MLNMMIAQNALLYALREYEHLVEVQFRARQARARAISLAIEAGEDDARVAKDRIYREIRLVKKHRSEMIRSRVS